MASGPLQGGVAPTGPGLPEIYVCQAHSGCVCMSGASSSSMLSAPVPLKADFQSKRNEDNIQVRPQEELNKWDVTAQDGMCPRQGIHWASVAAM